jgi:hypothetical protein
MIVQTAMEVTELCYAAIYKASVDTTADYSTLYQKSPAFMLKIKPA